ncbi:Uncharacterised protein [Vibrio cholerae]|uniref:Uncharacterized protein n=1 Tax=Vibrio cholerae TaxID=666 RepID=A0A655ZXC7_VIBCL|nr:Uncharacterised protein [Vibrio cholerae]CSD30040.1 Uncharacterised protein [Vibrio cholerae]
MRRIKSGGEYGNIDQKLNLLLFERLDNAITLWRRGIPDH